MARPLLALALATGLLPALTAPALACGGFFCMRVPMDQAGERIVFVADGYETVAHVQITYQGDAKKFSWVVPTPTEPKLGVGSEVLFSQLETATRPQFQLAIKDLGDCEYQRFRYEDGMRPQASRQVGAVEVVSQAKVGPYDSAVIRSNDPAALKTWLRKNAYEIPAKLDPMLDPYVAGKYYFVALKLQQDRQAGDLQPITLRYRATKPGIPIRLTAALEPVYASWSSSHSACTVPSSPKGPWRAMKTTSGATRWSARRVASPASESDAAREMTTGSTAQRLRVSAPATPCPLLSETSCSEDGPPISTAIGLIAALRPDAPRAPASRGRPGGRGAGRTPSARAHRRTSHGPG